MSQPTITYSGYELKIEEIERINVVTKDGYHIEICKSLGRKDTPIQGFQNGTEQSTQ